MDAKNHDYHLVEPSPWPVLGAVSAFVLALGGILYMRDYTAWVFIGGAAAVALTMFFWWRDVIVEAMRADYHTPVVQLHLRYGMLLFIASEVMFFVAWFWAYFNASIFPADSVMEARSELFGKVWPPQGIETFNPWDIPFLNTIVLLLSGTTVTWAHHALLENDRKGLVRGLTLTVLLGLLFTSLQVYEYIHASFGFSGHVYGATFLYGNRLPWGARDYRHDISNCLFIPRAEGTLFSDPSISALRLPRGIGTSWMSFGSSCSSPFIFGADKSRWLPYRLELFC